MCYFDGAFEYSAVIVIINDGKGTNDEPFIASIYPNPESQAKLRFSLKSFAAGTPIVHTVVDSQGNVLAENVVETNATETDVPIEIGRDISPGLYFIFISQGNQMVSRKFIVK